MCVCVCVCVCECVCVCGHCTTVHYTRASAAMRHCRSLPGRVLDTSCGRRSHAARAHAPRTRDREYAVRGVEHGTRRLWCCTLLVLHRGTSSSQQQKGARDCAGRAQTETEEAAHPHTKAPHAQAQASTNSASLASPPPTPPTPCVCLRGHAKLERNYLRALPHSLKSVIVSPQSLQSPKLH